MDYSYQDFTEENYKKLLKKHIVGRNVSFYSKDIEKKEDIVIWRHDIDMSVHRALKLAQIEREYNISSTFFVHFNSKFYNVFEKDILSILLQIIKEGHQIGLHFDATIYNQSLLEEIYFVNELLKYKRILEEIICNEVLVFSFHNPTKEILEKYTDLEYAGMVNAYSNIIREKFFYCSDSNGYWRYIDIEEFLTKNARNNIHVLTHPVWWTNNPMPPRARVQRAIDGRRRSTEKYYDEMMTELGRNNIGFSALEKNENVKNLLKKDGML